MVTPYVQQAHAAHLALGIGVGAFVVGEFSQVLHLRTGANRTNTGAEALFRLLFFGGILMFPLGRVVAPDAVIGGGALPFYLGLVIGWLGLLLRWWSFVTLGTYFTVILKTSDDQPVIDRGPYRVLRHPSYTGLLLAFAGCGLMLGNWASTAGSVVLVLVALVFRIRVEERALTTVLGAAYRDFASTRARLVPFVW